MNKKVIVIVVIIIAAIAIGAVMFFGNGNRILQPSNENTNSEIVTNNTNGSEENQSYQNDVNQQEQRVSVSENVQNIAPRPQRTEPDPVQLVERTPLAQDCATKFLAGLNDPANFDGVDLEGAKNYPYGKDRNMILKKIEGASFVSQNNYVVRNVASVTTNYDRSGEVRYRIVAIYEVEGHPEVTRENAYNAVVSETGLIFITGID